jgi:glutaredoxin
MLKIKLSLMLLLFLKIVNAQEKPIKVIEKKIPNRLALYAINESKQDYDVMITITGTNFRQSKAKPRLIRVPSATKVHLKTLVLLRGKTPSYTYDLYINDSLSRRALKKPYEKIQVKPRKQITVYVPEGCISCDSLLHHLSKGRYKYAAHILSENLEMKKQLQRSFGGGTPLDSLKVPIVNLGGRLYTRIETHEALLEELDKD